MQGKGLCIVTCHKGSRRGRNSWSRLLRNAGNSARAPGNLGECIQEKWPDFHENSELCGILTCITLTLLSLAQQELWKTADCVRSAWGRGTEGRSLQASFPAAHSDWTVTAPGRPPGQWIGAHSAEKPVSPRPGSVCGSTYRQVLPLLDCLEQANRWDKQQTNKNLEEKAEERKSMETEKLWCTRVTLHGCVKRTRVTLRGCVKRTRVTLHGRL